MNAGTDCKCLLYKVYIKTKGGTPEGSVSSPGMHYCEKQSYRELWRGREDPAGGRVTLLHRQDKFNSHSSHYDARGERERARAAIQRIRPWLAWSCVLVVWL